MKAWWRGSRRSGRGDRRRRCPRVLVTLASTDDGDGTGLFASPGEGEIVESNVSSNVTESSCFIDISTPEEDTVEKDADSSRNEERSIHFNGVDVLPRGNQSRSILRTQTSVWEDEPQCSNGSHPSAEVKEKNIDRNFIRDSLSRRGFYVGESGSDLKSLVVAEEDPPEDCKINISFPATQEASKAAMDAQNQQNDGGSILEETGHIHTKIRPRSYTESVSQSLINRKNIAVTYSKLISPDPPNTSDKISNDTNLASVMEEGKIMKNVDDNARQESEAGTVLTNGDPVGPGRKEESGEKKVVDQSSMKGFPSRRLSPKGFSKLKIPSTLDHLDVALPHVHTAPASTGKSMPHMFLSPNLTPAESSSGVSSHEGRKFSFPILRRHSHTVKSF